MEMNYKTLTAGSILHSKIYNYIIEKTLGQGSFGITYLAKVQMQGSLGLLESNIHVTIKEFFMKEINGREGTNVTSTSSNKGSLFYEYKEKFAREAKNLSKLKHPNIVNVMEFFEANNTCYYVMEFLSGGDLDTFIERRDGLSEEETIRYINQIGSALSFMHTHKMLHLDLKPKNVMLNNDGDAILIDFGLSKQYDNNGEPESSTTVGRGTPGYAPLEQANYQDGRGFPVTMDVYALGATMYKMLTNKRAPEASVILNEGFPDNIIQSRGTSKQTSDIVKKAMSPLKKDRFQSVQELINDLSHNKQQEFTIVELPLSITTDVESIEIYHDEGSIPNSHYYKFIIPQNNTMTFEIGLWGEKKESLKLENYSIFYELIDKFKDYRLTYTDIETGEENFTGGENTRITIKYINKEILLTHQYGSSQLSFGTLHGDIDSLISFLFEITEIKELIELVHILEETGDDGYEIYSKGHDAFKHEKKELAYKLFQKSAEKGDSHGQCMLGYCYETGFGTVKNQEKAISWYEKSSLQNNPTAIFNLATVYKEGRGVTKDLEKAIELYKKSADLGDKDALEHYNALCEHKDSAKDKNTSEDAGCLESFLFLLALGGHFLYPGLWCITFLLDKYSYPNIWSVITAWILGLLITFLYFGTNYNKNWLLNIILWTLLILETSIIYYFNYIV